MTFDKLSNNLHLLMADARINANELARRTGIPASSIKKIRNNDNPNPTLSTLAPIAQYFAITVSQLIGDIALPSKQASSPSYSTELDSNAIPIITWDEIEAWPHISTRDHPVIHPDRAHTQNAFGLTVTENNWGIFTKDTLLLIEPTAEPQQHDYVIIKKDKQNTCSIKQILIEDGELFLKSTQVDNYILLKTHETILGVIIEYRKYLR